MLALLCRASVTKWSFHHQSARERSSARLFSEILERGVPQVLLALQALYAAD
jgi:hypothetical protein